MEENPGPGSSIVSGTLGSSDPIDKPQQFKGKRIVLQITVLEEVKTY